MPDSLHRWLLLSFSLSHLVSKACKLPDEYKDYKACPIAVEPSNRTGCTWNDSKNRQQWAVACPKAEHSCLAIFNPKEVFEEGLCIRNKDNAMAKIDNSTSYYTTFFQWENPCKERDDSVEYIVETSYEGRGDMRVCCGDKCTEKSPELWGKEIRFKWMAVVGGVFTGLFGFMLSVSVANGYYKKHKAKKLVKKCLHGKIK